MPCPPETHQAEEGKTACQQCPGNTHTSAIIASSWEACVPCPNCLCLFVASTSALFLPFFVFLRSSVDSAGCRRRPSEARGGQLFPLEQPAVHLAGWNPIQREGQDDFCFYRRPAGLTNASGLRPSVSTRNRHETVGKPGFALWLWGNEARRIFFLASFPVGFLENPVLLGFSDY